MLAYLFRKKRRDRIQAMSLKKMGPKARAAAQKEEAAKRAILAKEIKKYEAKKREERLKKEAVEKAAQEKRKQEKREALMRQKESEKYLKDIVQDKRFSRLGTIQPGNLDDLNAPDSQAE